MKDQKYKSMQNNTKSTVENPVLHPEVRFIENSPKQIFLRDLYKSKNYFRY